MPPLVKPLSRHFSREASGLLTTAGHDRLLVIGDSSLDYPDSVKPMYYLGNKEGDLTAGAAFRELAQALPIEHDVFYMESNPDDPKTYTAPDYNKNIIEALGFSASGILKEGKDGFKDRAKPVDPDRQTMYILTASDFAYDCILLRIGHSQLR